MIFADSMKAEGSIIVSFFGWAVPCLIEDGM
jgi:hypothetical protein